jgi:Arc/MetJ family transcription regulator
VIRPQRRYARSPPSGTRRRISPGLSLDILQIVSKHLVDLDEDALEAAQLQLGTSTIKDTVNTALRAAVVDRDDRIAGLLNELASIELDDRADAWR